LIPATRRLGLHEVRVYELQATAEAAFSADIPADKNPELPRRIGQPWLSYGIADVRGLEGTPRLRIDSADVELQEGFGSRDAGGVHTRLAAPDAGTTLRLNASLDIALGGTESLALVPLARSNVFRLESTWPHPRFGGSFLPGQRQVSGNGFTAEWEVSSLATGAQAQFLAGHTVPSCEAIPMSRYGDDRAMAPTSGYRCRRCLAGRSRKRLLERIARPSTVLLVVLTFVGSSCSS
jgi:inner membrane protein